MLVKFVTCVASGSEISGSRSGFESSQHCLTSGCVAHTPHWCPQRILVKYYLMTSPDNKQERTLDVVNGQTLLYMVYIYNASFDLRW